MLEEQENSTGDTVEEDLLLRPRHRTAEQGEMDITPMIDITFLLLIFFLVAARIQQTGSAQLPTAQNGDGVSAKTAVIITVTRGSGENDEIYKGDKKDPKNRIDAPDLAQQELLIAAYVESEYRGEGEGGPKERVIIKGAYDVRSREIARVARAVGMADTSPRELQLFVAVRESGK